MSVRPFPLVVPRRRRLTLTNLALPAGVLMALAGVVGLAVRARGENYLLRATSDSPTFLSLIPKMAAHPFQPQSPYLANGQIASSHATPYTQLLAFLWREVAPGRQLTEQPLALARMLALVGIVVFAALLACVFYYARAHASNRAAWLSLPVLLLLFGPANVIWASDLSFHGLLYGGYFPQNVALCLLLATLLLLERQSRLSLAAACLLAALTMLVHPFTGVLLCVLATGQAVWYAAHKDGRFARAPRALGIGFALGLAWPAYSLPQAFSDSGLPALPFLGFCILAPLLAARLPLRRLASLARPFRWTLAVAAGRRAELALALLGMAGVVLLSVWERSLLHGPTDNPLSLNRHLAVYWVEDRWRWPLLYAAGSVGLVGLARLARRGQPLPAFWTAGCFAVGLAGLAGAPIPVWWRFLLFAQVPLALGVAVVVSETRRKLVRYLIVCAFSLTLFVKCSTLLGVSPRVTYFGSDLQEVWSLGREIPAGNGLVASDPFTSYYLPAVTGRPVLTVTKAHVGSPGELRASASGYELLHRFATWNDQPGYNWWQDARGLWQQGVRYVVVEHSTSLLPKTLDRFSTGPTPLVRTARDRAILGRYMWRLNRIGHLVADDVSFGVWRLDGNVIYGNNKG